MTVYLVGAGPGAVDLLTLRAARLLQQADAVVVDRLVDDEVLGMAPPWAERIRVGKDPYGASVSQHHIHHVLLDLASRHETVIRLKGGDPFVFGRGGEEAQVLIDAGIDVEVVPGVSSVVAGPAAAGIPVTHRDASSGFTVVTAHQNENTPRPLDWSALARLGTTLVIAMGARRSSDVRKKLLAGGMEPDTPIAIVTNATKPHQLTRRLRLSELGTSPIANPSIIVVGEVASLDLAKIDTLSTPFRPAAPIGVHR